MQPFEPINAIAAPIDTRNLDTNQLCPTRFNKVPLSDPDYQRILFNNQRYTERGDLIPEFILNQAPFDHAKVLVGAENFGCGSSRESAVYALLAFGIRAVIAPGFGDIFFSNCTKNGLLPVVLDAEQCAAWRAHLHANPGTEIAVDLASQQVTGPDGVDANFDIHPTVKERMLAGLDDVGVTLAHEDEIAQFEREHHASMPWVFQ